ncbi:siderophore ABC transporter substrate-binding protein [Arvimicrobium flavum]|uniref:siderophore ABC transporter substrate-binding protein n=1 Tax=Arvimicrobium flavum TaxID=3393320 RepID=UPI00237BEAF9|nr:siderophore ABC transporter substrate-binding protein [Mesorhizobium shangrilense]
MINRRKLLNAALGVAAMLVPLQAASAEEFRIEHTKGEIVLPERPKKVVVFDLATIDTLDALGVDIAGVPKARFPAYLSKYNGEDYAKVGSLFEPDLEALNALQPDLIIVGGRSSAKYDQVAALAPTIDLTVDQKDFVGSAKKNIDTLARLFGKESEAAEKLAALDATVAGTREAAAKAGKGLIVLTTGGKMSAYGPGSRFGVLYSDYGITPAREDLKTSNHGHAASFELILETNPDWLFVIDRDAAVGREGQSAAQYLDNELVAQTTAWKNGQVVYLDPARWYLIGAGLQAMQLNADQIAKALRKE